LRERPAPVAGKKKIETVIALKTKGWKPGMSWHEQLLKGQKGKRRLAGEVKKMKQAGGRTVIFIWKITNHQSKGGQRGHYL